MAGNLEFIKSASGTSVSSLSVTDCFSDKYDVYQISLVDAQLTTGAANYVLEFLDSGGTPITSLVYERAFLILRAYNTFIETRGTGLGNYTFGYVNASESNGFEMFVYNPYSSSDYTFLNYQHSSFVVGNGNYGNKGIGVMKSAETVTGIKLAGTSGTFSSIAVSVYGVK